MHAVPLGPETKPREFVIERLRRTQLCKHHLRGFCQKGEACAYAHSNDEVRPKPNLMKTKLCRFAARGCQNPNCTYAHGLDEIVYDPGQGQNGNSSPLPFQPHGQGFHPRQFPHASPPFNGDMRGPAGPNYRPPNLSNGYQGMLPDNRPFLDGMKKKSSLSATLNAFSLPTERQEAPYPKHHSDLQPWQHQYLQKATEQKEAPNPQSYSGLQSSHQQLRETEALYGQDDSNVEDYRLLEQMAMTILKLGDENDSLYHDSQSANGVTDTTYHHNDYDIVNRNSSLLDYQEPQSLNNEDDSPHKYNSVQSKATLLIHL